MKRIGLAVLGAALLATGCVERHMTITSEPAGADVVINQTVRGKTPFTYRFKHYGTYDIRLEAPGHYPLRVAEPVVAPFYEQPGVDIVAEALVPARIKDNRALHYKLEKIGEPDDIDEVIGRSDEAKKRSDELAARRAARDGKRKTLDLPLPEKNKAETETPKKKDRSPAPVTPESAAAPADADAAFDLSGAKAGGDAEKTKAPAASPADGPEVR